MDITWREMIDRARDEAKDGPIIKCTLTDEQLDVRFYRGYGGREGEPFTAWTEARVYFPAVYDGAEWVESVPRDPCDEVTDHVGGG